MYFSTQLATLVVVRIKRELYVVLTLLEERWHATYNKWMISHYNLEEVRYVVLHRYKNKAHHKSSGTVQPKAAFTHTK